jgi:tRNA pseudouridine55 synthase
VRAVGHAGTLDPFATGLLVVLVGRATRLARFVESERKTYRATVRFGIATDTDDGTGAEVARLTPEMWPERTAIEAAAHAMLGTRLQRPPAYSAKHVDGRRAYDLARRGETVELAPVPVTIEQLDVVSWTPPDLVLDAVVGKGTYLRAIARDLGESLGIPAHCATLRRTSIGLHDAADAIAPQAVRAEALRTPAAMVAHLPRVVLDAAARRDVGFGRAVTREGDATGPVALVGEDGVLVAIAEAHEARWQPVVVLEAAA